MGVNFFETPPNKQQCTLMHETLVASGAGKNSYNNLFWRYFNLSFCVVNILVFTLFSLFCAVKKVFKITIIF